MKPPEIANKGAKKTRPHYNDGHHNIHNPPLSFSLRFPEKIPTINNADTNKQDNDAEKSYRVQHETSPFVCAHESTLPVGLKW